MSPDTGTFTLHRTLPLPPDRLWRVLTDPVERGNWAAPVPDMAVTVHAADQSVGGTERHSFVPGPDSGDMEAFEVETRWYRLQRPVRAIFTETVGAGEEEGFTSLVTYALTPRGDGTDLAITVAVSAFAAGGHADIRDGWEGGLANLDRYIASLAAQA